jgi:hypothetical protein
MYCSADEHLDVLAKVPRIWSRCPQHADDDGVEHELLGELGPSSYIQ